jgi:hypothetical protein
MLFGQVTWVSVMVNSSTVNPPATAGVSGGGLITVLCPAWAAAWRSSPAAAQSPYASTGSGSSASNRIATAESVFSSPQALVSSPPVVSPVVGSMPRWARKPSRRAAGDLRLCRVAGSTVEITRSGTTRRAMRHRPSVPSEPSAGSTSCPATKASNATACACASVNSISASAATSRFASPTSIVTSSSRAAGSDQSIFGFAGVE